MSAPAKLAGLDQVTAALGRVAAVDEVLDLADSVIEHAAAEGAVTTLVRLAELLGDASQARPDARGLAVAAARARAAAAALPVERPSSSLDLEGARGRPLPLAGDIRFAGWWRRAGAFVVDWVLLLSVLGVVPGDSDGAILFSFIVLPIAYFAGLHAFAHGRTVGKWIFGTAVRGVDGGPVYLPRALGRAVLQCVLWLTVIGGIVDSLLPLGDARRRTIHDRAAGTAVVRVR